MRYILVEYVTGKYHPYMPNTRLWRYKDMKTGRFSLGAWTTPAEAEALVARKNMEISVQKG